MPWDFTKIPSSGTTKWDFSLNKLIEMVDAGDVSLNDLPDKTRASILSYKLRTGAISKDNLSTKDWQLLTRQGMSPATTEDISKAYATQGVKNPPEKYPYWYGQLTSGLLAPVPTDSSKINPPRSTGEKILGDVLGTAGALASMPGMVGRGLASLAPKLAGALQIGGMTAVTELPKVMTQQETPTEAARNVAISAAVGAAGDVVAPLVRRSVANTLAKYFPEQLPKALETAVPYVAPVAVGAGVGAAQGTAKQVTKWIAGEPIDLSQAIKDIGAEAAIMGTVNGIMAAMGLVPKGNTAGYYKFAKSLIQAGADNPDTFMEIPGMPGLQFQYNPKTARIGYRIDPDAIPNFLQQAEAMGSLQTIAPEATQTTGAIQPVTAETIQTQAGESIQPAPLRATTGLAVPTTAVSSTIKPGDTVYDPRGTKLTVVDASDPSLLTVQNEQGTTFKIGRKVVSTEPPSERATKPVETTSAAKTIETTSTPKMEASIASTVATESPFAVGDKVQFTDGSKTITARIIRELGWSDTHPYREYIVEDESTKRQYSVIEPLLSKVEEKAPEAPETATPEAAALVKSETPKTTSEQPQTKEPWQMTQAEYDRWLTEGTNAAQVAAGHRAEWDNEVYGYAKAELIPVVFDRKGAALEAAKSLGSSYMVVKKTETRGPARWFVVPTHRAIVEKALHQGKPVPPEVLKDYPDLAEKYAKPAAEKGKEPIPETSKQIASKPLKVVDASKFKDIREYFKEAATADIAYDKPQTYLGTKQINITIPSSIEGLEFRRYPNSTQWDLYWTGYGTLAGKDLIPVAQHIASFDSLRKAKAFVESQVAQGKPFVDFSKPFVNEPTGRQYIHGQNFEADVLTYRQVFSGTAASQTSPEAAKLEGVTHTEATASTPSAEHTESEEGAAAAGQGGTEAFFGQPIKLPKKDYAYVDPVNREQIVKTLSKQLNIPIRVGRYRSKALGIFKEKPEVIRTKLANDLPVIAHEVGHYLDKKLDLSQPRFDSELLALGENTSKPSYSKEQIRKEGVAEYLRLYLTDPEQAQNSAPEFHKFFEATMEHNPEIRDTLLQARADITNWMSQPAKARILSQMSIGEHTPRKLSWDRLYAAIWDELAPLQKAVNEMSGGKPIPIDKDPFRMAWLARGWTGKAETYLMYGVLDDNFNKIGPSLREILEPVKDNLDDFRVYLAVARAQELHNRGIESGFEPEDVAEILQDPEYQKYEPVRQGLLKFQDAVLQEVVKSGRISAKQAEVMRQLNQDYVPFYRVMDDPNVNVGFGRRGYANVANPVKRIKGSGRRVIDPLESIVRNTFYLTNIASRNEVGKLLADLADVSEGSGRWVERIPAPVYPTTFRLEEIKGKLLEAGADITGMDDDVLTQIFRPVTVPPGKENILIVYRDGKPEFYQCDPELYRTMLWLNRSSADILTKILRTPASWLRAGAVLSPEFVARNPVRDQFSAFLFSKFGYVPGYDLIRGLFHVANKDDLYWKWKAAGGGQAALVSMDRDYMQKTLADLLKDHKVQYYMSHPLDIIRALSEGAEESTRIGEFIRGLEKLGTSREAILEAALASRDVTLDFNRKGWATGPLNQVIAFFNASLQDLDKLQRAIRENPKRFFLRVLVSITIPSIILYLKNRKDSRYQRLPDWLKDNYWIITTKDNIVRLPKPFMPGLLFGTVPERIMAYIEKQDPSAFDGLDNTIREAFPDLMPTALIPWVEVIANKDLFRGAPIVPAREQKLPAEMQYAPYTSETAKWLGDLLNASPRIIDHIIQGYGGGTAQAVTDALDALLEALGIANPPPKPAEDVANVPVLRGFTYSELRQSGYVDKVYTQFDELSRKVEGAKRGHGTLTAQENKQYIALKNATDALNNIGKQIRTIEESQQFTSEQKAAIIKRLRAIEDAVAMQALGVKE